MTRKKQRPRKAINGTSAASCAVSKRVVCKAKNTSINTKDQRYRPGTAALRDIRRYERSTELLLLRAPFERLVRDMLQVYKPNLKFQPTAVSSKKSL